VAPPAALRDHIDRAARRLFYLSFVAIVSTAFGFVLRAITTDDWGGEFALTETQKGEILGAGLWPFAVSITLLSFVVDRLGFRTIFWFGLLCLAFGTALTVGSSGYGTLYFGTLCTSLGAGAVEAGANPLVSTLFVSDKTRWLNKLHAGWPGGLVAGGLLAIGLGSSVGWRYTIALGSLPILAYAWMMRGQTFPVSERVAAGVTFKSMLAEAGFASAFIASSLIVLAIGEVFGWSPWMEWPLIAVLTLTYGVYCRSVGNPLFVLMVLVMIPLATTELGTDSWLTSLMEPEMVKLGLNPGWVLVYTAALMLVLRLNAGPLVHRLQPLGLLALGTAVATVGLWSLSMASGMLILLAATLYGLGKAFFWPTSLGFIAEQFPRGGAVALSLVGGVGYLAVGSIGSVMLGSIQDHATERVIVSHDAAYGSHWADAILGAPRPSVFGSYRGIAPDRLSAVDTVTRTQIVAVTSESKKHALRSVALLPVMMLAVYLLLMLYFRSRGGYRPRAVTEEGHGVGSALPERGSQDGM
jgi:MFS family permease